MSGRGAGAVIAAVLALGGAACLPSGHDRRGGGPADAHLVLYRDRALIEEDIVADVRGHRAVLPMPAGVAAEDLAISSDDVHVVAWSSSAADGQRDVVAVAGARTQRGRLLGVDDRGVVLIEGGDVHVVGGAELLSGAIRPALIAEVDGRDGRARFRLRYPTDRLSWQASYTLVDHDRGGRLHGALVIDNQTGRRWRQAALAIIDAPAPDPAIGGDDLPPAARLPGRYAIEPGPQRLELALRDRPLPLRSTLVYDPVGPALDHPTNPPEDAAGYGVQRWPTTVDATVKIELGAIADVQLPAGPVRLAAVDGSGLAWRGEGELLPPATDAERYLTIAIGRIDDVSGRRARTDFVKDAARQRLYEEITVTLTSTRRAPVDVLVREHLYRGPCWKLAYHSTGDGVAKEGAQRIALTTTVPAGGTATVVYRVIYHWSAPECSPPSTSNT